MDVKLKRAVLIASLAAIPAFWNACGQVGFQNGDANYKSCVEVGADYSNCFSVDDVKYHNVSQSIPVTASSNVDILFVIDNSGSMAEEQVGIGNKINGFLDKIKDLNWQIAVTTTDPGANTKDASQTSRPWGDGQFRPFDSVTGNQYVLRSSQVSAADAQVMLANAIQMGTYGSGDERGINATYRAVQRAASPSVNKDFFRADAKLAVITISDEDECSNGSCSGSNSSNPNNLISLISSQFNGAKAFTFNSIIWIPNDTTCSTGGNQGNTYKQISNMTGGVMASICSNDYATPLASIGNRVVNLVNDVTLTCQPVDINNDGKADLQIKLQDGTILSSGFTVNGLQVSFASPLPEGTATFSYFCK
jgi:hypothetical protein